MGSNVSLDVIEFIRDLKEGYNKPQGLWIMNALLKNPNSSGWPGHLRAVLESSISDLAEFEARNLLAQLKGEMRANFSHTVAVLEAHSALRRLGIKSTLFEESNSNKRPDITVQAPKCPIEVVCHDLRGDVRWVQNALSNRINSLVADVFQSQPVYLEGSIVGQLSEQRIVKEMERLRIWLEKLRDHDLPSSESHQIRTADGDPMIHLSKHSRLNVGRPFFTFFVTYCDDGESVFRTIKNKAARRQMRGENPGILLVSVVDVDVESAHFRQHLAKNIPNFWVKYPEIIAIVLRELSPEPEMSTVISLAPSGSVPWTILRALEAGSRRTIVIPALKLEEGAHGKTVYTRH